jgi:hypothetical protein
MSSNSTQPGKGIKGAIISFTYFPPAATSFEEWDLHKDAVLAFYAKVLAAILGIFFGFKVLKAILNEYV